MTDTARPAQSAPTRPSRKVGEPIKVEAPPKNPFDDYFAIVAQRPHCRVKENEACIAAQDSQNDWTQHDWTAPACYRGAGVTCPMIPNFGNLEFDMRALLDELERDLKRSFTDRLPDKDKVNEACRLLCDRMLRRFDYNQTVLHIVQEKRAELYEEECLEPIDG